MSRRRSSKSKIRYAVVGLGHIAQTAVLPAFANAGNSKLLALVSGDQHKLKQLGNQYELQHLYSYQDYGRALSNVEAVYLALPNHLHREYAVRAAAAGVHVLCEKPMAVTEQDCQAMITAAEQNHTKLMIAYRLHFEAGNLHAIDLANSGRLGELRIFTSNFCQQVAPGNIRVTQPVTNGGGTVYDMGVYCTNAARYLFRSEPVELSAVSASRNDERFGNVEEMASVVMRFPGEKLATFTSSFGAAYVGQYTLVGTKGVVRADPAYGYAEAVELEITLDGKSTSRKFPKRDQFAAELLYFSDCILKDKDPEPSGTEGLLDVRIIEAIYESIRTRQTIRLAEPAGKKRPQPDQQIYRPAHDQPEIVNANPPSRAA